MPKIFEPRLEMLRPPLGETLPSLTALVRGNEFLWDDCFDSQEELEKKKSKLLAVSERHFCLFDDCVDEGFL